MEKEKTENISNLRIALVGLIVLTVILFIIGLIIYKPEPVVIQGSAEANEVRISGKVAGRIQEYLTEEGQRVELGDTLVLIDSPEIYAKLAQATAAQNAAKAQDRKAQKGARSEVIQGAYEMWKKAEVGVDIAKKSFDRVQHLFDKGVVTSQKRDEAEAQYQAAVAQSAAAKSQYEMAKNGAELEDKAAAQAMVDRAQGAVQEVEAYMKETTLIAPISGEVTEIFPKQGELIGTGAPIMNIVDLDDIWFSFNVREDLLNDMKQGSVITVKIPALNNQKAKLKITYIKAMASFATWKATKTTGAFDLKTFEVRAKPIETIKDLRPGMTGLVVEK
ncbi:MAG: efflux RND transporter periplasmic adaptor subunit [Dysgonamonadaceae bacterium]|jgi:HlyD family secretion protein|nr:efflux RND transporter periplasmic adaptor subunit [Dysgonamonadaceae bacterium]MDD3308907.1 efflux RND transporter periplasmic adaptor subunit [Dysgonamonadaceae bacterium]MDD3900238.1 efflux RND transporter periplasmic adaptor subunit [Dysgonamonadaceae bacterium]MDD4398474.1 efflux RND transporter periplasmic adaptor subunit [Dysgonamonadaceae bacterium]MEA5081192.1 efflux RND transporter periplasmic adaptor subunit [Dysgonamonadaceae bacterium]